MLFFLRGFQLLGGFSHVITYRGSSKNTRKMNLQPILNKNSPWAHMKSKLDVFGVVGKLVKYVVYLSKKNLKEK
jgi:hypothetical protein